MVSSEANGSLADAFADICTCSSQTVFAVLCVLMIFALLGIGAYELHVIDRRSEAYALARLLAAAAL